MFSQHTHDLNCYSEPYCLQAPLIIRLIHAALMHSTARLNKHRLCCTIEDMTNPSQHSPALHSLSEHSTAQHSTAQHSTAQHGATVVRGGMFTCMALRPSMAENTRVTEGRSALRRWPPAPPSGACLVPGASKYPAHTVVFSVWMHDCVKSLVTEDLPYRYRRASNCDSILCDTTNLQAHVSQKF